MERLYYGLCDVTYDGVTYHNFADEVKFSAVPSFQTLKKGALGKEYLLQNYDVNFEMSLNEETYNTLRLANPSLKLFEVIEQDSVDLGGGAVSTSYLYDNPSKVNTEGKRLTIHPLEADDSKQFDITIFEAYLDPEQAYERTFRIGLSPLNVRFIGKPSKQIDGADFYSFYFIGDVDEAGVLNGDG